MWKIGCHGKYCLGVRKEIKCFILIKKRLFENEKQELKIKFKKLSNQIKEEQEQVQKLQIEMEHKKE